MRYFTWNNHIYETLRNISFTEFIYSMTNTWLHRYVYKTHINCDSHCGSLDQFNNSLIVHNPIWRWNQDEEHDKHESPNWAHFQSQDDGYESPNWAQFHSQDDEYWSPRWRRRRLWRYTVIIVEHMHTCSIWLHCRARNIAAQGFTRYPPCYLEQPCKT